MRLNWAPLPFERVVGLYMATLFCLWQVVTFVSFRTAPSLPILAGGTLIVAGGLIVTFWRPGAGRMGYDAGRLGDPNCATAAVNRALQCRAMRAPQPTPSPHSRLQSPRLPPPVSARLCSC